MKIITIPVGTLGTNCYLLTTKSDSCAVIDPGAQGEKIIAQIEDEKLKPRYILITHGHHDHIGGVKKLASAFPDAKIMIGKNDADMLTDTQKSYAALRQNDAGEFIIETAETLEDGDELILDELKIKVMDTPGHTKGGVCYICGDSIFSGDTLFFGDVGRCDLYGGDYGVMKASLRKLCGLNGQYHVYPGHGGETSLDYERKNNSYIAEALNEA